MDRDGGTPPRDAGGGGDITGVVEVRLAAVDEDELELESGQLFLRRVRARSDRGASDDPVWLDPMLAIEGDPVEANGVPATYGGVLLEASPTADCGAELVVAIGEARDVVLCIDAWVALDLRCASPVVLRPDDRIRIDAELDMGVLATGFVESVEDGERVDRTSRPHLFEELYERWSTAWSARCEGATDSGDSGG